MAMAYADSAQQEADRLYAIAKHHKKQAGWHRRRMQETMAELDRLRRACDALGIKLIIAQSRETESNGEPAT